MEERGKGRKGVPAREPNAARSRGTAAIGWVRLSMQARLWKSPALLLLSTEEEGEAEQSRGAILMTEIERHGRRSCNRERNTGEICDSLSW